MFTAPALLAAGAVQIVQADAARFGKVQHRAIQKRQQRGDFCPSSAQEVIQQWADDASELQRFGAEFSNTIHPLTQMQPAVGAGFPQRLLIAQRPGHFPGGLFQFGLLIVPCLQHTVQLLGGAGCSDCPQKGAVTDMIALP